MSPTSDDAAQRRAANEIAHGKHLAGQDPDLAWGWGSPAGRLRADRRAALIVEGGRVGANSRAVEVGCGSGLFTERFLRPGGKVVAVELSPDLLAYAQQRGLPPDQVRFVQGRFEDAEFGRDFDAVIGSSVLHHLELDVALERAFDVLRPGGWLSFAEPNMLNPQIFLERKFRRFFPLVSPDETAFRAGPLRRRLEAAGFVDVQIEPFDWLHPAVPEGLIPAVSWVGSMLERTPLARSFAGSLIIRAQRPPS
ncbi:MAG: methyltransferase domain-containing protein [Candidatus Binatia bacterium]|nr:methyltransferase domain-containing protein [Candidatus Binatia bacterium]